MTTYPLLSWLYWWFVVNPAAGLVLGVAVVATTAVLSRSLKPR
jgi:hypothetical protein